MERAMLLESVRKNARSRLGSLELPLAKHSGISLYLTELNFERLLEICSEKIKIKADSRVNVIDLSKDDELYAKYINDFCGDKVSAIHYAILNDAKLIVIPENACIDKPIIINSSFKSKSKSENIVIVAKKNSKAAVIETSESSSKSYFKSQIVNVIAEENSKIDYISLHNLHNNTCEFSKKYGTAKKNSSINWVDVMLGGKLAQLHIKTCLAEAGASTKKSGASFANNSQHFEANLECIHEAENTNSMMAMRSIVENNSETILNGNLKISKDAKNSNAHQKYDALLIGENAKCDAVPILDVENDEVSCSHGVAIGQIDEDQVFYMQSRGLGEDSAKKMIVVGFLEKILKEITQENFKKKINMAISMKLMESKK